MMQVTLEELSEILLQKDVEIYRLKTEIVALKDNISNLESTINKQNDEKGEDENAKINKK